jgi:hypothetical protein
VSVDLASQVPNNAAIGLTLLGRFLGIVSNKRSNKKSSICKMLVASVLQFATIALLRRWLRVQALLNSVSLFQLVFLEKKVGKAG